VRICSPWNFSFIFSFIGNNSTISEKSKTDSEFYFYSFNNSSTSSLQNEHEHVIGAFHNHISPIIYSISFNCCTALQHNFHDNKCFGEQKHVFQKAIRLGKGKDVIIINAIRVENPWKKIDGNSKVFITFKNNEDAKLEIENTDDRATNKPINTQKLKKVMSSTTSIRFIWARWWRFIKIQLFWFNLKNISKWYLLLLYLILFAKLMKIN
jgi:hypothetical protein